MAFSIEAVDTEFDQSEKNAEKIETIFIFSIISEQS